MLGRLLRGLGAVMRTIVALLVSLSLVGCGASSIHHTATPVTLASQGDDALERMQEVCQLSAHVTRRQRPIVVDGVSFYCF